MSQIRIVPSHKRTSVTIQLTSLPSQLPLSRMNGISSLQSRTSQQQKQNNSNNRPPDKCSDVCFVSLQHGGGARGDAPHADGSIIAARAECVRKKRRPHAVEDARSVPAKRERSQRVRSRA